MNHGKVDRQLIIDKCRRLFQDKGYHNTTMDDIAKSCNVQKSSLYHHIPTRKALLLLLINQITSDFKEQIFKIAYDEAQSTSDRLTSFGKAVEEFFTRKGGGQLLSNLAIELSREMQQVSETIQQHFNDWITALSHLLGQDLGPEKSKLCAENVVAQIQGALFLDQLYQSQQSVLERAIQNLLSLESQFTTSRVEIH